MSEKLIIKNFADIKSLEIELNKINILIGPQASGKSICAKLLFYFKNFVWEILNAVEDGQSKRQLDAFYSKRFEAYFPPDSWGKENFIIRYEISDTFIQILKSGEKTKLSLTYSDFYKKELSALRRFVDRTRKNNAVSEPIGLARNPNLFYLTRNYWSDNLTQSLDKRAAFSQLFIPASRSFFAFLERSIFSFLSNNKALDPFITTFGSVYENVKRVDYRLMERKIKNKEIQDEINGLVEKILCGKYLYEKGKDFIVTEGRRVSVANSSSGQQETLPLAIMISSLASYSSDRTVYVEEPEAHLFPSAQRDVVELIATVFNFRPNQLQFFITTHSPYILTAINNLLQAGILYRDAEDEVLIKLKKIVPRHKALLTNELAAYSLVHGNCKSIICKETGLIDANIIDSVSDELAIEFDKLLNLT
jgi:AAA15 family ATPase/GTPase